MSTQRKLVTAMIAALTVVGSGMVAVPFGIIYGPVIEPQLFPVLKGAQVVHVQRNGEAVAFDVVGEKARPCRYIGASALSGPRAGFMEAARISFPGAITQDATRPMGIQAFGLWHVAPVSTGELVSIQIRHDCHPMWETTTQLGPWRVPPN